MLEMLRSKAIIGFIALVLGIVYIGNINNPSIQNLEYEEINNIVIVNE